MWPVTSASYSPGMIPSPGSNVDSENLPEASVSPIAVR
jgi:hypothetical protein